MAQVNGLLDWIQTPAGIGLLSAVAGGMAGAQRGTPWNNAGRAGIAGLAGYTGAKDQINKESDNALTRQYKQMQMQELESKIAQQKALREAATSAYQDATNPAQFAVGGQTFPNQQAAQMSAESMFSLPSSAAPDSSQPLMSYQSEQAPANIADFSGGQTPQITQQQAPDVRSAMYSRLMQAGFPEEAAKYAPAPEEYGTTPFIDAEGNAQLIGKTGKTKTLPFKGAPKEGTNPFGQDLREYFAVNGIDPRTATPEQLQAGYRAVDTMKRSRAAAGAPQMNNYGTSFTAAVDGQGNPVLLQPSKYGGQPNVVEGYTPADDAAKARKAASAASSSMSNLDRLETDIKNLRQHKGLPFAVGISSVVPIIPGTPQADAVANIQNLADRAAVAAINEMREMSATGGAVGQVTEKEWPKLEAQKANLNRKQSYRQFVQALDAFEKQVKESKRLIEDARRREPGANKKGAEDDPLGLR